MFTLRIILMKNNDLKISDFGMSKFLTTTLTFSWKGTPVYMAPEIWNGDVWAFKSDIW
jgi:serine/threonine protein kinase